MQGVGQELEMLYAGNLHPRFMPAGIGCGNFHVGTSFVWGKITLHDNFTQSASEGSHSH